MTSTLNCSLCKYATDRKFNLQRHYEKVHGQMKNASRANIPKKFMVNPTEFRSNGDQDRQISPGWDIWQDLHQTAELYNITANSRQTFEQLDFLQRKANFFENELSVLYQNCWIIPRQHVLGLSGFVCTNCKSLSVKPILDLGYDRTMQSRHRCAESNEQRSYFKYPISPDIQNIDAWAGRVLKDQLDFRTNIEKYLYAQDATSIFDKCGYASNPKNACDIMGIPDRYPLCRLEEGLKIGWIKRALDNLGNKIPLLESDILDFLTRVKSTYAILEIPTDVGVRQILMAFAKRFTSIEDLMRILSLS